MADVILVAFEGPDRYSYVGGLGTRMRDLAEALVDRGYRVHHLFVGDPGLRAREARMDGRLTLERWGQWISAHHPRDVYDGEIGKWLDFGRTVPRHLVDNLIAPAAAAGKRTIVLFEDWQTADAALNTAALLAVRGLRASASLLWNANNTYGFERIDLPLLGSAVAVSTISRWMRAVMQPFGVDPLVLPNGIASRWLRPLAAGGIDTLRAAFGNRPTFVKIARFDPDKRWLWAIDAIAALRASGTNARLLLRGGRSEYGAEVFARVAARGLTLERIALGPEAPVAEVAAALARATGDIVALDFFIAEGVLRSLYAAADGVLANSEREPFGLVGLEVMACGGIAYVGRTGEDYAIPYGNSVVVQTDDPRELGTHLGVLKASEQLRSRIRAEGRATAQRFSWSRVLDGYEAAWESAARLGR